MIGLKHTAKGAADMPIKTVWIEMPPEDVRRLIKTLQDTLSELDAKLAAGGDEVRNG